MKKIITISREFGAGGGIVGRAVAKRLNFDYCDKEIILKAAYAYNADMGSMIKWDERVPMNFGFAQSLFDFYNKPLDEKLFEIQTRVIRDIGEKGNCVIVGRNANAILKEFDNGLHVFIHASQAARIQLLKGKMPDASEAKIKEEMAEVDRTRRKYCMHYTKHEFGAADGYDLCLNTSTLGIDACVDTICRLAQY